MTDYHEVLDECQRLADYWMNEQDVYDVEIAPRGEEYRAVVTHRASGADYTEWFSTMNEVESHLDKVIEAYNNFKS